MIRYRRNIDCLTTEQRHDLREALAAMYQLPSGDPHSFATLAGLHGEPPPWYCRHGSPGFFTWHRAYLLDFERALRCIRPKVTLPFWDWSSGPSTGVPAACRDATYVDRNGNTVANPLYAGPLPGGGQTARRPDIDSTDFSGAATTAQAAMTASSFSSFQNQIDGVHGSVHGTVGGNMGSVSLAAYDPIFWLHHANVDRLWAQWQHSHPGPLPPAEATFELVPFNRPYSTAWQRGSDMESTEALGYRYLRFCLFLPPIRFWEVVRFELPRPVREQMTSARLAVRSTTLQRDTVELRVFVDQPRASERTKTVGNPSFVGAIGLFGAGRTLEPARDKAHECPPHGPHGHDHEHGRDPEHGPDHGPGPDHGHGPDDGPGPDHGHGGGHAHARAHDVPRHHEAVGQERMDVEIDITRGLREGEDDEVALKIVAVGVDGAQVPAEAIDVETIELVVD